MNSHDEQSTSRRSTQSNRLLALVYAEAVADLAPGAAELRRLTFDLARDRCYWRDVAGEVLKVSSISGDYYKASSYGRNARYGHEPLDDAARRYHAYRCAISAARGEPSNTLSEMRLAVGCGVAGTLDFVVPYKANVIVAQWDSVLSAARLWRRELEIVSL